MIRHLAVALTLLTVLAIVPSCTSDDSGPSGPSAQDPTPTVLIKTSMGTIAVELYVRDAPISAQNFIDYVGQGFYNDLLIHRVIAGFMIQGGIFTTHMQKRETRAPIVNEATNGLLNERGTIAMARTSFPHSATSSFFINLQDNPFLDHKDTTPRGYGYAVFGRVVCGMDIVDTIAGVKTESRDSYHDVPVVPITIDRITLRLGPESDPNLP